MLIACVVLLAAACGGPSGTDDALSSAIEATPSPTTPGPSPAATEARATETASSTDRPSVTQTDTDWGRMWDALPPAFPVYPAAVETEVDASVSAAFTAGDANPEEIVTWMQQQLELATYSTEALSGPLEDGSFVIDSVGDAGCRIETTVTPAGELTLITVRYGADCPFE